MTDELLFKYVSGQAVPIEILAVQEWMDGSEKRKNELARLRNIWILAGLENEIDPISRDRETERIWNIIRSLNAKEQRRNFFIRLSKYAAIFLFFMCISGVVGYYISDSSKRLENSFSEIIVPKGQRSTVVLPDGSKVQLNSDTHLKFVKFDTHQRIVRLEGEGYFDVTHDPSRPFTVETTTIQVEVLGTSFNVTSYEDDPCMTTYLSSGKVKITDQAGNVILNPSEAYTYNKVTHESTKRKIPDQRYSSWTKGIMVIEKETIGALAKRIERRFNVKVIFGDNDVQNHVYTGTIGDQDLNTILKALEFASSIKYKRNGDTVSLFSKN
jgi:ferric-dicitrate binding protein FerR (iron transport regulator)